METMTLTIEVPNIKLFDKKLLEKQLTAFAKMLTTYPFASTFEKKDNAAEDIHIFDCLHTDWGGDKDPEDIAEELRNSRIQNGMKMVTNNKKHFSRIPGIELADW